MFLLATDASSAIQENLEQANENISKLKEVSNNFINGAINFAFDLLAAIIILIIGKLILKLIRKFIKKLLQKSTVDIGVERFVDSLVRFIGYVIIIITICSQIGIQTTSLITLLGTAGLSIGLALQGALSNFAGGVLILISKPFVVGDYILVNGVEGTVQHIDIVYTTLSTIDNKSVKIPNGIASNNILTNFTRQTKRRVDVKVGVHYDEDLSKVKKVLTKVMNNCNYILKNDENMVVVRELAESSIVMEIRMWVPTDKYWDSVFYLNEEARIRLGEAGIEIPYNKLDVNILKND